MKHTMKTEESGKPKTFHFHDNVGGSKYAISFHDGKSTHPDIGQLFSIKTFKNKKDFEKFQTELVKQGYRHNQNPVKIRRGKDLNVKGTTGFTIETEGYGGFQVIIRVDITVYPFYRKVRVVFTETPVSVSTPRPAANKGASVTAMIEQLATELVKTMPRVFNNVPNENIRWYERYMSYCDPIVSKSIDRVKMEYTPDGGFTNPVWSPVWQNIYRLYNMYGTTI